MNEAIVQKLYTLIVKCLYPEFAFFYTWCAMGLFNHRLHEWSYHPFMEPFNTWRGSSDVIIIYNGQYMHSTPLTRSLFYHVCSILLRIFFLTPCLMLTLYNIFPAVRLVFFKMLYLWRVLRLVIKIFIPCN